MGSLEGLRKSTLLRIAQAIADLRDSKLWVKQKRFSCIGSDASYESAHAFARFLFECSA